jgi:hypothetical protein
MFKGLHARKGLQLMIGLILGILFGFLLQKGGVTKYDVIISQLLLTNFTVVKVMLSAVVTGMIGVHLLRSFGLVTLHPKTGSFGSSVIGGLIFGVGFALLGYCPGTIAGAVGQGSLDGLLGGMAGILVGAGLFAEAYPKLDRAILRKADFGEITFPELFKVNPWVIVLPVAIGIVFLLFWIERAGL